MYALPQIPLLHFHPYITVPIFSLPHFQRHRPCRVFATASLYQYTFLLIVPTNDDDDDDGCMLLSECLRGLPYAHDARFCSVVDYTTFTNNITIQTLNTLTAVTHDLCSQIPVGILIISYTESYVALLHLTHVARIQVVSTCIRE